MDTIAARRGMTQRGGSGAGPQGRLAGGRSNSSARVRPGCTQNELVQPAGSPPAFLANISNPVSATGGAGQVLGASTSVCVSLPPGTIPGGESATVDPIAGSVQLVPGVPWSVRFIPADSLASWTMYELVVSPELRDHDGDTLESQAVVVGGAPHQLIPDAVNPTQPEYWDTQPTWSRVRD